jgi:hypothetical protein
MYEPSASEIEMATEEVKRQSPGIDESQQN